MKIWFPTIRAGSGSDVYVERLAGLLKSAGHEPVVTWFAHGYELLPWFLKVIRPPEHVDVIHANSWNGFAFASANIPLLTTVHHAVVGVGYPDWKSLSQRVYHDYFVGHYEKLSVHASRGVVAVSESTAKAVQARYGIRPVVIPNWIDTDLFVPGPTRKPTKRPIVLMVGNPTRRKGSDLLVPFRVALRKDIEFHLVCGRRQLSSDLGAVDEPIKLRSGLTQDELIEAYQQADVVISLSRHEGFGYTAIEAMACGCPFVGFDVPGLRDVVDPQQTGILVPVNDVQALASACHELIDNEALSMSMGMAGQRHIRQKFSCSNAITAYASLYETLIRDFAHK